MTCASSPSQILCVPPLAVAAAFAAAAALAPSTVAPRGLVSGTTVGAPGLPVWFGPFAATVACISWQLGLAGGCLPWQRVVARVARLSPAMTTIAGPRWLASAKASCATDCSSGVFQVLPDRLLTLHFVRECYFCFLIVQVVR